MTLKMEEKWIEGREDEKEYICRLSNSRMRGVWMFANHGLDEIHCLDLMAFSIVNE